MKAILVSNKIYIADIPRPKLSTERDVLVKVMASGLCGSDVQRIGMIKKRVMLKKHLILGHEITGKIVKVGSKIEHDLKVGDKVVVEPLINCLKCLYCKTGNYQFCVKLKSLGKSLNGGFTEYVVVPSRNVYRLGFNIPYNTGVLIDSLAACIHASNLAGHFKDKNVAIIGDGTMGRICVELAKLQNAKRIVLIGKNIKKTKDKSLLIIETIFYKDKKKLYNLENKFDVTLEAVGRKNSETLNLAINLSKPKGKIIVLGVFPEQFLLTLNARKLFIKEIVMIGSNSYSYSKGKKEIAEAVNLINNKKLKLDSLITHVLPLIKFKEGLELFRNKSQSRAIKVVFKPHSTNA